MKIIATSISHDFFLNRDFDWLTIIAGHITDDDDEDDDNDYTILQKHCSDRCSMAWSRLLQSR